MNHHAIYSIYSQGRTLNFHQRRGVIHQMYVIYQKSNITSRDVLHLKVSEGVPWVNV